MPILPHPAWATTCGKHAPQCGQVFLTISARSGVGLPRNIRAPPVWGGGPGGVRAAPGGAPLLAPSPACLFKRIKIKRHKARAAPRRAVPPVPPPRCGARPFPAVCCHLPSAAAGGGSRGAPRSGETLPRLPSPLPGRAAVPGTAAPPAPLSDALRP